mmetsp:Transcript_12147/g.38674  ORF Transcript_12147/g.38674 Transcript_12147/m.38674 type:complete len:259 (+) Transcript_12147:1175-1951(+)
MLVNLCRLARELAAPLVGADGLRGGRPCRRPRRVEPLLPHAAQALHAADRRPDTAGGAVGAVGLRVRVDAEERRLIRGDRLAQAAKQRRASHLAPRLAKHVRSEQSRRSLELGQPEGLSAGRAARAKMRDHGREGRPIRDPPQPHAQVGAAAAGGVGGAAVLDRRCSLPRAALPEEADSVVARRVARLAGGHLELPAHRRHLWRKRAPRGLEDGEVAGERRRLVRRRRLELRVRRRVRRRAVPAALIAERGQAAERLG